MNRKIGAPKGGRVHWLLWNLPQEFKREYELTFNYATHNYLFTRYYKRKIWDVFIVVRTSKRVWRCMYVNALTNTYEYISLPKSRYLARRMWLEFKKHEKIPERGDR